MVRGWPLVERDRTVDKVRRAFEDDGLHGVIITGAAGVGKTHVFDHVLARAEASGRRMVRLDATPYTSAVPFGAADHLLEGAAGSDAAVALARHLEPRDDHPTVVAIDDVHHLDDATCSLVLRLAIHGSTKLLATRRSGHASSETVRTLVSYPRVESISLAPLTLDDVEAVLVAELGGPVDKALSLRIHDLSEGNPLFLTELIPTLVDTGSVERRHGLWCARPGLSAPARLGTLIDERLDALDPDLRRAMAVIALGRRQPLSVVESLAAPLDLFELERQGLIRVEDPPEHAIRIAHPMWADHLDARLPAHERSELLGALADAVASHGGLAADGPRFRQIIRWRLAAGRDIDDATALRAAEAFVGAGEPGPAEACARLAWQRTGTLASGLYLGTALHRSGRYQEAEEVLSEVQALTDAEADLGAVVEARVVNLQDGLVDSVAARAVAEAARTGGLAGGDPLVVLGWLEVVAGEPRRALATIGVTDGSLDLDATGPEREPQAVYIAVFASYQLGDVEATRRWASLARARSDRWPGRGAHWLDLIAALEVGLEVQAGSVDDGLDRARAMHGGAVAAGNDLRRGWAAMIVGAALAAKGRFGEATSWFQDALLSFADLGKEVRTQSALAWLALCAQRSAPQVAAEADAQLRASGTWNERSFDGEITRARARRLALDGEVAAAVEALVAEADAAKRRNGVLDELLLRRELTVLGHATDADLARIVELGAEPLGAQLRCSCDEADARLRRDAAALGQVAARYAALGATVLASEAARAAHELLAPGSDPELEAMLLPFVGRTSPQGSRGSAVDAAALTPRELQIARLVAAGAPSRAVAAELGVSVRTVDNTLRRTYRKLGIAGRHQLVDALPDASA